MKWVPVFLLSILILLTGSDFAQSKTPVLLKNIGLIDGNGKYQPRSAMLISGDTIAAINPKKIPANARQLDLNGKTIMPSIINTHAHLGLIKGTLTASENYTRENILRQLRKYDIYGVEAVLSLGTDYDIIFRLRDSSRAGKLPGAMLFTAGYGFGVENGAPPFRFTKSRVFRPINPAEAEAEVKQLALLKPDLLKIWVDDFYGKLPKMKPEIYSSIITEAHKHGLRVAAHVFHLEDAKSLVDAGVDILAHSIRDAEIDDDLVTKLKQHSVTYIPSLVLDLYQFAYINNPPWFNEPFFKKSLEPGVYEYLLSDDYLNSVHNNPELSNFYNYFKTALINLKKLFEAGVMICLGTDSGATPVRAQGFSEHLEMTLFTEAGLTPLQAITLATRNGARLLKIDKNYGTLEKGKKANFLVLNANPENNIKNTRNIFSVWKNGVEVSRGPLTPHALDHIQ